MKKISFLFNGQGSQSNGMGKDLYDNIKECREVFEKADEVLKYKISDICFSEAGNELFKGENAQPAIIVLNMAIQRALEINNIKADVSAGLSLGEYSALIYADVLKYEDVLLLVKKRAELIEKAVPEGSGGMVAVMNLSKMQLQDILRKHSGGRVLECSNYNCPSQIVISGESIALDEIKEIIIKEKGKYMRLTVRSPFHCSLLKGAAAQFGVELEKIKIMDMSSSVYSNVKGSLYNKNDDIKDLLVQHIYKPVLFNDIIDDMLEKDVDVFIEIVTGKSLSRFVKTVKKNAIVLNVSDMKTLNNAVEYLNKI